MGFKPCGECHRQMSVSDPHLVCLWCLGSDHNSRAWADCKSMHPKAIRKRVMKLPVAWQKKAPVVLGLSPDPMGNPALGHLFISPCTQFLGPTPSGAPSGPRGREVLWLGYRRRVHPRCQPYPLDPLLNPDQLQSRATTRLHSLLPEYNLLASLHDDLIVLYNSEVVP